MNPQGNNNQTAPDQNAAPAGPWNAGIQINNAPPPVVLPAVQPAQPGWREECRDEGLAAGDENLAGFMGHEALVNDSGSYNWALIDDMSNSPGAPHGMRMALISMAFLIKRRNTTLRWLRDLRRRVELLTPQLLTLRIQLVRAMEGGVRGDPLTKLRNEYLEMRGRLIAMQQELEALQDQVAAEQSQLMRGQRDLKSMFRSERPFMALIDEDQYTRAGRVVSLPAAWPQDVLMVPGERAMSRYPVTTVTFILCLVGMPLLLLHPDNPHGLDRPAGAGRDTDTTVIFFIVLLQFAHLVDVVFVRRRRH